MLAEIDCVNGKLVDATNKARQLQDENSELQMQSDEAIQEAFLDNTSFAKATLDLVKSTMGLSSSKTSKSKILTQSIQAKNKETKHLKQEHINLQKSNELQYENLENTDAEYPRSFQERGCCGTKKQKLKRKGTMVNFFSRRISKQHNQLNRDKSLTLK